MAFLAFEQSQRDGNPVELFLFQPPNTVTGTGFTNAAVDIVIGAQLFEGIGISRDEASYDRESNSGEVRISMSVTQDFARRWIILAPAERYVVTIFRPHITDSAPEPVTWW